MFAAALIYNAVTLVVGTLLFLSWRNQVSPSDRKIALGLGGFLFVGSVVSLAALWRAA